MLEKSECSAEMTVASNKLKLNHNSCSCRRLERQVQVDILYLADWCRPRKSDHHHVNHAPTVNDSSCLLCLLQKECLKCRFSKISLFLLIFALFFVWIRVSSTSVYPHYLIGLLEGAGRDVHVSSVHVDCDEVRECARILFHICRFPALFIYHFI